MDTEDTSVSARRTRFLTVIHHRRWELIEYVGEILGIAVLLFSRPRNWNVSDWSWWSFYVPFIGAAILVLFGKWKQEGNRRRVSELLPRLEVLAGENAELRGFAQDAINQELLTFALATMEFSNNERVSLYFRRSDGFFQLAGRYSPDSSFKDPGRTVFSDKESLLVQTYREGNCDEQLTPKEVDPDAWRSEQQGFGLSTRVIRKLRMPTSHYVGFGLRNASQVDFAVIIFESIRTDVLIKDRLREEVEGVHGARITRVLEQTIEFLPDPKAASKVGL